MNCGLTDRCLLFAGLLLVKILAGCALLMVIGRVIVAYGGIQRQSFNPRLVGKGVEVAVTPAPNAQSRRSLGDKEGAGKEKKQPSKPLCGLKKTCESEEMAIRIVSGPDTDSALICVNGIE